MIILDANQIRAADQFTIENEPIPSIDLMERASARCVEWIVGHYDKSNSFHVVSGMGNNGGDGLVIARLLLSSGYTCRISIFKYTQTGSKDFEENLKRLKQKQANIQELENGEELDLKPNEIIVDAIFGSGLTRPIENWLASQVNSINKINEEIVSVDMPSGLYMVDNFGNNGAIVKADYTLTFETPKLSFLFPDTGTYSGKWIILDIGLNKEFLAKQESRYHYLMEEDFEPVLVQRKKFDHKGNYGHALIIAGSKGKIGAAILASRACLKAGVGLLTGYVPECGYTSFQSKVSEAMCITSEDENEILGLPSLSPYSACAFGPGIGASPVSSQALKMLIQESNNPLVIDADGLNILANNKTWLQYLPPHSILTPHPGEFKRLVGEYESDMDRIDALSAFSEKYRCIVVLKGAYSAIAVPDGQVFFNSTGNPGMATAGSGDVLTGIITSFLAQGYHPVHAACLGVYYHGKAGDIAAEKQGEQSMIAGDIVNELGESLKVLRS
ncbi:MAG: bifunctional ADP-dependent NAD(P)H-hydrate dehydratase/NAD(P)H-hydrate epimerase [Crocinitomicaceae bacterium]|nr:bifunctional ADP-dependent NAD(P)H-hydrate dehydratase/NAD(P)H-hydrate epimerase [Crocinitomicaceae bacterium]